MVVIYDPRRVGKTTLLKKYLDDKTEFLFVTGEDIFVREHLSSSSFGNDFKWGTADTRMQKLWRETYPNASFECINKINYIEFVE